MEGLLSTGPTPSSLKSISLSKWHHRFKKYSNVNGADLQRGGFWIGVELAHGRSVPVGVHCLAVNICFMSIFI